MNTTNTSHEKHSFHIPVMGVGFTIDTPLKVAKHGISSVISLVDDVLIEQMREFHSRNSGEPYEKIGDNETDARARRITAYLNLIDRLVSKQMEQARKHAFEPGSDLTKYYEMLPENSLKQKYRTMLETSDKEEKTSICEFLKSSATPGSIDVNIMTKLDRPLYRDGKKMANEFSDAMSALRGFANSSLRSAVVFSAGMNQRLYSYASEFKDFYPDATGVPKKKIILKVSDYRSALIQGKFLAKRGLWISEFRIESGLNCGGHAFATKGHLIGPILEEFKTKRQELFETLFEIYLKACEERNVPAIPGLNQVVVTMQGGIATNDENEFLLRYYNLHGTGWATPFLLAPDVANVDEKLLAQLCEAADNDVFLSGSSPMGVPFWNLRNSPSETQRAARIAAGKPGSPCPKRFIALNSEFSEVPICTASRTYQQKKLAELENSTEPPATLNLTRERVLEKSCICHDLGGSVKIKTGIEPDAAPAVCCGPSISFFTRPTCLEEVIAHIYGRLSLLADRTIPHIFVRELKIYIEYLKKEMTDLASGLTSRTEEYFAEFKNNLLEGIEYYRTVSAEISRENRERFLADLENLCDELKNKIRIPAPA